MKQAIGMPFDHEWDWLPDIYYISPYATDFRYGVQINKHVERLPQDSWIVLTDYDTCWLTPNYGIIINNAIAKYGDSTDLFTCEVNRLGNPKRCYGGDINKNPNIVDHIKTARMLEREKGHECEEVEDRIVAGVCMIFHKSTWEDNKFDEHPIIYNDNGHITSFDVRWTEGIKGSIKKIKGLYLWHTYRLGNLNISDTQHLEL